MQALTQLAELGEKWKCGDTGKMRTYAAAITAALAGPLLWDDGVGMYVPSSGNNAKNTDVWGSALAVHLGLVPAARAAKIVAWFGAHWSEVVQDGQVKHLARGQYWAETSFWEYDVYQNGGFWGTASGWVLPVIAMNNSAVAAQLVRDAVADAKANGLNEWKNSQFSSGCRNQPSTPPLPPPPPPLGLDPQSLSHTKAGAHPLPGPATYAYCMHADWVGGAMQYGPNIGSVYQAALLILGGTPPPPPPPPPTPPPPVPPAGPMPLATCDLSGSWTFLASTGQSEINNFTEAEAGTVLLTPGRHDLWKHASGVFAKDWSLRMTYNTGTTPTDVVCTVKPTCGSISCAAGGYTYTREK